MTDNPTCADVRDLLPELATGTAAGEDRARALRHLAGCPACRRELDATTTVVDELLLLAPEREPSPGFESSVLAALSPTTRPRSSRTLALAVAAGLIGAVAAVGTTWWVTEDERDVAAAYRETLDVADGRYFVARTLKSAGQRDNGHVFAYEGRPSWVFLTVDSVPPGRYRVRLRTTDGSDRDIGWCDVSADGRGSWGTTVDVAVGDIAEIRLRHPEAPTVRAAFRR